MVYEYVIAFFVLLVVLSFLGSAIKVVREYERRVVFRLGRLLGVKGPGIVLIIPMFDRTVLVDLRTLAVDVPKQRIVTRD
ncbi:MAG TPA: SPFH domain-containing protein, partial [Thermoplasmata archaeon]|nr:SPFH domain-containing protein [Thermoplasmata archaeon]